MKLANEYRAARRNSMHPKEWREKNFWQVANANANARARWAHTEKARKVAAAYLVSAAIGKVSARGLNDALAEHWMKFKPRTRCISRMLRTLETA